MKFSLIAVIKASLTYNKLYTIKLIIFYISIYIYLLHNNEYYYTWYKLNTTLNADEPYMIRLIDVPLLLYIHDRIQSHVRGTYKERMAWLAYVPRACLSPMYTLWLRQSDQVYQIAFRLSHFGREIIRKLIKQFCPSSVMHTSLLIYNIM